MVVRGSAAARRAGSYNLTAHAPTCIHRVKLGGAWRGSLLSPTRKLLKLNFAGSSFIPYGKSSATGRVPYRGSYFSAFVRGDKNYVRFPLGLVSLPVDKGPHQPVPKIEIVAVVTVEFRMVQVVMSHGIRVSEEPVGLHFLRNELVSGMARRIHQFIVKNVGQQDRRMHRNKQDQQRKKTELKNCLERLKRKNRPWRRCDRFMMTRMQHPEQGARMHQAMGSVEI